MKLRNPIILKDLRKFYFQNNWKHNEVQGYLKDHYNIQVSKRNLKRWKKNLQNNPTWNGPIPPKPPNNTKITQEELTRIVSLRKKTGWGPNILKNIFKFDLSESTYKRIIQQKGLSRGSKTRNKRVHWVKWQRYHPDSTWQLDGSENKDGSWTLPVIDDCSRYCIGLVRFESNLTTKQVTDYLESLFIVHGKPREILTDNGTEFGQKSNNSEFDGWCEKWGIKHIRARIHKPTTMGKVERFHQTRQGELIFVEDDLELFRYRYNHIRPHQSLSMKTPASVYFDLQQRLKTCPPKKREEWW